MCVCVFWFVWGVVVEGVGFDLKLKKIDVLVIFIVPAAPNYMGKVFDWRGGASPGRSGSALVPMVTRRRTS